MKYPIAITWGPWAPAILLTLLVSLASQPPAKGAEFGTGIYMLGYQSIGLTSAGLSRQ